MKDNPGHPHTDEYNLERENPSRHIDEIFSDSYSIEDDDTSANGLSPRENADSDTYSLEDDAASEAESSPDREEKDQAGSHHPKAWRLMLYMIFNPLEGWKRIRRAGNTAEDVARECFYPLAAIAAVSCFLECVWNSDISLNEATIDAVKVFVSFFFGNFLVLMLIKNLFPKEQRNIADSDFGKQYVMYNLSTMALFYILYGCFPMLGPVLVFLPIWTIYLALRGARFFRLPQEKSNLLKTLLCIFITAAPAAVYWVMDAII